MTLKESRILYLKQKKLEIQRKISIYESMPNDFDYESRLCDVKDFPAGEDGCIFYAVMWCSKKELDTTVWDLIHLSKNMILSKNTYMTEEKIEPLLNWMRANGLKFVND